MGNAPDFREVIKERLKEVDVSDGVSKDEAIIIAQNYMMDKNCDLKSAKIFGEDDPYWPKDCWHVEFKATFIESFKSGLKWATVSVDKKTGEIRGSGAGPS